MDIAGRVKFFREKKGITINKLANIAGVSQSFLREIELSKKKPTVDTLSEICNALGITLKEFFDDATLSPAPDDGLSEAIFKLSPEQRKRLAEFIKSMI
jgi:transcriptional regulator with XRE-family HTH domain